MKKIVIAGFTLQAIPTALLAQKEIEKDKKDKGTQTIIVTRTGDTDEKTILEIDGDKVKINGKDAKYNKYVNVNVTTMKGATFFNRGPQGGFSMNMDDFSLLDEDENRAMLGVNTDYMEKGARIVSVNPGSAADKAGLKKGDIITKINNDKIDESNDITKVIRSHKPGTKVDVTYLRDDKEQKAAAELGMWKGVKMNGVQMPRVMDAPTTWNNGNAMIDRVPYTQNGNSFVFGGRPKLGLSIQDTEDGKGVKVLEVDEESNAAKAGIKENDIILSVDDKEVKATDDVTRAIRENKEKYNYNFKIQRDGKTQTLEVKLPRKLKTAEL
jgi:serine protease Do